MQVIKSISKDFSILDLLMRKGHLKFMLILTTFINSLQHFGENDSSFGLHGNTSSNNDAFLDSIITLL